MTQHYAHHHHKACSLFQILHTGSHFCEHTLPSRILTALARREGLRPLPGILAHMGERLVELEVPLSMVIRAKPWNQTGSSKSHPYCSLAVGPEQGTYSLCTSVNIGKGLRLMLSNSECIISQHYYYHPIEERRAPTHPSSKISELSFTL